MPEEKRKRNFPHLRNNSTQFKLRYLIGENHDAICKLQSSYKVYVNTISNGELSDFLCDSVNRGLNWYRKIQCYVLKRYCENCCKIPQRVFSSTL